MRAEKKNIIERILDAADGAFHFRNAVFLTYTANLDFFEGILLQDLLRRGCDNNLILMDRAQYRRTFELSRPSAVGTDYVCAAIRTASTFHPKVTFLCSEKGAALFVGSGNTTQAGFSQNQETFWELRYEHGANEVVPQPIVATVRLLAELATRGGSVARARWGSLLADSPWVGDVLKSKTKSEPTDEWLLSSTDGPILDQVVRFLDDHKANVKDAIVVSPFFDDKLEAMKRLVQKTGCKNVTLLLSQGHNNLPRIDPGTVAKGARVVIKELVGEGARPLHAKILLLKTNRGAVLVSGSANFSRPALCDRFEPGNFEVCMMQYDKSEEAFDALLVGKTGGALKQSEVVRADILETTTQEKYDAEIEECVITFDGRIVVRLVDPIDDTKNALAQVTVSGFTVEFPIKWKSDIEADASVAEIPSDAQAKLISGGAAIKIVRSGKNGISYLTAPCWISHEVFVRRETNSELGKLGRQLYLDESTRILSSYYWWIQRLDTTLNVRENELEKQTRVLEETESEEAGIEQDVSDILKADIYVTENFSEQELRKFIVDPRERHSSVFDFFGLLRRMSSEKITDAGDVSGGSEDIETDQVLRLSSDQKERIANKLIRYVSEYEEKKSLTIVDYNEVLKLMGLAFVGLSMHILDSEGFVDAIDRLLARVFLHPKDNDQIVLWKNGSNADDRSDMERRFLDGPFLPNAILFLNFCSYLYNKDLFQLGRAALRYEGQERVLEAVVDFWRHSSPTKVFDGPDVFRTTERLKLFGGYELDEKQVGEAVRSMFKNSPNKGGSKDRALRCRAMAVSSVVALKNRTLKDLQSELSKLDPKSILDRSTRLRLEQEVANLSTELIDLEKAGSKTDSATLQRAATDPGFLILSCK